MTKTILLNLGDGSLTGGLPRITAQLWTAGHPLPQQYISQLPAEPELLALFRNWQLLYNGLCQRFQMLSPSQSVGEIEVLEDAITNISRPRFAEVSRKLATQLNTWLRSGTFSTLEQQLRSQLSPTDNIRIILETEDKWLRRLPWHQWDFFGAFSKAEMALFSPEFERPQITQKRPQDNHVSILAVLGDAADIDLTQEQQFLGQLQDATVEFLISPSKSELEAHLQKQQGWDIFFFAGHSDSQVEQESGRLYLNPAIEDGSLSLEELDYSLRCAIANGLQLAIFNSCDGLGLAKVLEQLHIPVTIVMREPVPNKIAQLFLKHFLDIYALQQSSLYLAVRQARLKLQDVEEQFPGASWLPVICQNPAFEAPNWLQLGGIAPCPYRGLTAFKEEDADLFFGREKIVASLFASVNKLPLVALVGPSGSGKSSVVLAGLVPYLKQQDPPPTIIRFRPGNNLFQELASSLALADHTNSNISDLEIRLRDRQNAIKDTLTNALALQPQTPIVLIADQFEECFTLCEEADQQLFLERLLKEIHLPNTTLKIVLTLRADFFGHALNYRPLSDALQGAVLNLSPMNPSELAAAIEKPAARAQVTLEKGLTDKFIQATYEHPGRLPLLQFALTQLWSKQRRGVLTHHAFSEIGGVETALARHADAVFTQLSNFDQKRTRKIFMQLVRLEENMEATRRLAKRDEITSENWDLVVRLATARLVVTSRDLKTGSETVEVTHEALIRIWERLKSWIQEDGAFRQWQETLRSAQRNWEENDLDSDALLRGRLLSEAEVWLQKKDEGLSKNERDFILASSALRNKQLQTEKRRLNVLRLLLATVSTAFLVAVGLGTVAFFESQRATRSQIGALASYSDSLFRTDKSLEALVQAVKARQLLKSVKFASPQLKQQTKTSLLQALYGSREYNRLKGAIAATFSPDGSIIATSDHFRLRLWNKEGAPIASGIDHTLNIWKIAFSPDGQQIATASEDQTAKLWNLEGKLITTFSGHRGALRTVAFHPGGKMLVTAGDDSTIHLWSTSGRLITKLTDHTEAIWSLAFSPDGKTMASAGNNQGIKLWQVDGEQITLSKTLPFLNQANVRGLAFSPDGKSLAASSYDGTLQLWSRTESNIFSDRGVKIFKDHQATVSDVAFSPDGQTIASVSWDKTIKQWNLEGKVIQTLKGPKQRIWQVAFSPDGNTLITGSESGSGISLWRLNSPISKVLNDEDTVHQATFSPDGQIISLASNDNNIKLWTPEGRLLRTISGHEAGVQGLAFTSDSKILASSSWDTTIKYWQVNTSTGEYKLLETLKGKCGAIWDLAFSPEGQELVSTCQNGELKFWDQSRKLIRTIKGHQGEVKSIAFNENDSLFASSSLDTTIKLWDKKGRIVNSFDDYIKGVSTVVFHPRFPQIATGGFENKIILRSIKDHLSPEDQTFLELVGHKSEVRKLSFHPNGKILASASADQTVRIWSSQGNELATLAGHDGAVWDVNFSPDGKWLISASEDGTARLWQLELALEENNLLSQGCEWLRNYLKQGGDVDETDRDLC